MTRIAGIIRKDWTREAVSDLHRMRECIVHEPSEVSDIRIHESLGVGIAWVCRPGSVVGRLPSENKTADVSLFFCGEELARDHDVGANGVDLIDLYEKSGSEFVERLNGGFCGVVADSRRNHVVLFNDRYATRRIYWHHDRDGFYFASEAKALLEVLPHLRQLDGRGLGEFLSCGCALQNRTLFSGMAILPAGACWTFHPDGRIEQTSYFTPQAWESQPILSAAEHDDRLRQTLQRVLPRYLNGDQPVGISLTGGLDSRLVLALVEPARNDLSCYTFGSSYAECADERLARRLAAACGLAHRTIRVGDEFLRQFPALAERTVYLSDGAMDVSGAVELYVNQLARDIAPIRLTGNYGSEILRSHVAFKPQKLDDTLFDGEIDAHLRHAETTYAEERRCRTLSFIAFKQVPWHHFGRAAIERSQVTMRSPYLDNELVKLAYQAPAAGAASGAGLLELAGERSPALRRIPTDRAVRLHPLPIVSRIAQLHSELTARAEYFYDYGMPHWLARLDNRLARLKLERVFLGRHKFYHFRLWYRDALAGFVRAVLLDSRALQRPYLNGRRVREIVERHTSGQGNHTLEIHKLLTLELLQRRLLERN